MHFKQLWCQYRYIWDSTHVGALENVLFMLTLLKGANYVEERHFWIEQCKQK